MKNLVNERITSQQKTKQERPQQFLLPMHRIEDSYLFNRARELDEFLEELNKALKADA